jgi:hypothetical protein
LTPSSSLPEKPHETRPTTRNSLILMAAIVDGVISRRRPRPDVRPPPPWRPPRGMEVACLSSADRSWLA